MTTHFNATCPSCGYKMDAHSAVGYEDAVPSEGDRSVCLACGTLLIFQSVFGGHSLVLRLPTDLELLESLEDPIVVQAMFAQRAARTMNEDTWPRGFKEMP